MAENPKIMDIQDTADQGISRNRRRLLKAAAASAPVIATLPSGAAMANSSIHECVIRAREHSNELIHGQCADWIDPEASGSLCASDTWVRVSAIFKTVNTQFSLEGVGQDVNAFRSFYIVTFQGETHYFAADYSPGGDKWDNVPTGTPGYELNTNDAAPFPAGTANPGDKFTDTDWIAGWNATDPKEGKRNVLVMWVESGTPEEPTGVYMSGIYPNAFRGDTPYEDNMGIYGSCLCSVDPQYRDTGIC